MDLQLEAGQGVVDVTPPLGIELAGFHRTPGNQRFITGIRHPAAVRALVLKHGDTQIAIVSVEILALPADLAQRVHQQVEQSTGIPARHVRLCATHTHSMPTFRFLRQWGAIPIEYRNAVGDAIVKAVGLAKEDLSPTDLYLGKELVIGGSFNRTDPTWKTEDAFTKDSTDSDRWLDRMLHSLYFVRSDGKKDLAWYHFSAHPVCWSDGQAGPDWPGLVGDWVRESDNLEAAFLQGHCGDVNPGDGTPWTGDPDRVVKAVYPSLHFALEHGQSVSVDAIRVENSKAEIPLDIPSFQAQIEAYQKNPSACKEGEWVDAEFAEDWARSAARWDVNQSTFVAPISAIRLGGLALLFHPAELYSYYGLEIQRDIPFKDTIAVGYTDDFVGYLTDAKAYQAREYAAVVVPKILDIPSFRPEAAQLFTDACKQLLSKLA
jgi:hypothetical protein